ncbi:MAG: tripartite tricarboxylate transporter permease, partial [Rhodospirillales bacterium]|nr:tripartite tricarboxylate transporter permease [Rhodospirillales bacterium]
NNATKGGALVPTVAFGIPGSLGAAILLGALLIQGLKPGPDMLTSELHVTFSMVWSIVVANILVAALLMLLCNQVAKVAFLPGHLIVPGVIVFIFMGAWLGGASMGDWVACISMGIVGFILKRGGWPRPPLVLALILGNILENSFQISMRAYDGSSWLYDRPVVVGIIVIIVITIVLAAKGITKVKRSDTKDKPATGEGAERNPVISLPFSILLGVVFVWAAFESEQWPESVQQFPLTIAVPFSVLIAFIIGFDVRDFINAKREAGGLDEMLRVASEKAVLPKAATFFGYLICILLVALVVGQKIALPLFVAAYLFRWGGYGRRVALGYAFGAWVFMVGFYDQTMHLFWHQSLLAGVWPSIFPEWIPNWLFI